MLRIYHKRCSNWYHKEKGLYDQNHYERMNKEFLHNFWLNEVTKSVNIFEEIPKYKEYIDILYKND